MTYINNSYFNVPKTELQNLIRYGDNTEEKRNGRKEVRI